MPPFALPSVRAEHPPAHTRVVPPPMAPVTVLQANLATICFSSALYGIFFVLAVTSLAITVRRHREESAVHAPTSATLKSRFRFAGPWTSPLFIATIILLLVISAVRQIHSFLKICLMNAPYSRRTGLSPLRGSSMRSSVLRPAQTRLPTTRTSHSRRLSP